MYLQSIAPLYRSQAPHVLLDYSEEIRHVHVYATVDMIEHHWGRRQYLINRWIYERVSACTVSMIIE